MKTSVVQILRDEPHVLVRTEDGVEHSGSGAFNKAARHLIAIGVKPKTILVCKRGERECLRGSVHNFALRTWAGAEKDPMFKKWRPMVIGDKVEELPPRLAAWWRRVGG